MELREGAGYRASYKAVTLIVTQERNGVSIVLHDLTKGTLEGRVPIDSTETIAQAKEQALDAANLYLRGGTSGDSPEWKYFDPRTPAVF